MSATPPAAAPAADQLTQNTAQLTGEFTQVTVKGLETGSPNTQRTKHDV